jgi:transcriptional regulator with XRE-family HTH domain
MQLLGKKLRQFRHDAGLKQTLVAKLVHCNPSSIARIESGERLPGVTLLGQILQIYKEPSKWTETQFTAICEECSELLSKMEKGKIPAEKETHPLESVFHGLSGLKSVYPDLNRELLRSNLQKAENNICVINTWLWTTDPMWTALENASKRGINIQILLLSPESNIAKQRLLDLGNTIDSVDTSQGLKKIKSDIENGKLSNDNVQVRLYEALPPFALYTSDNWGLMSVFWHGRPSFDGPHIELDMKNSLLGIYVMETYSILWNSASPFKI